MRTRGALALLLSLLLLGPFSVSSQLTDPSGFSTCQAATTTPLSAYENVTTHEGDLVINGTQQFVIENCTFIQKGNIYVKDSARLLVRNATVRMNQTYFTQYQLRVEDYGILELTDSLLGSEQRLNPFFLHNSEFNAENVTLIGTIHFAFFDYSKAGIEAIAGDTWINLLGHSNVSIKNSRITGMGISETCNGELTNSSIARQISLTLSRGCTVNSLKPGSQEDFDLKESVSGITANLRLNKSFVNRWLVGGPYDSEATISSSSIAIGIVMNDAAAHIENLKPGFHEYLRIGQFTFNRTEIEDIELGIAGSSNVTITNSTVEILGLSGQPISRVSTVNSTFDWIDIDNFFGEISFEATALKRFNQILHSDFYVYGDVSLDRSTEPTWHSCNVTRNYGVFVRDRYDEPVSDASLTLKSEENAAIWNGTTNDEGNANLNLTFTDGNYTDTLKLEAVRGNYSAATNATLLSDTPIVLKMHYFADLNADGTVNILDITIVAKAFESEPGASNWNDIADLDGNQRVNIVDLANVAKDYGKTV